jgi:hypothetical protein
VEAGLLSYFLKKRRTNSIYPAAAKALNRRVTVRQSFFSGNVILSIFLVLWALVLMFATASHATDAGPSNSGYSWLD